MPRYYPDFATFEKLSAQPGIGLVPVYRQVSSDSLTPVLAFHRLGDARWSFLFESVVGGEKPGRYSFLGADPFARFVAKGNRVTIHHGNGREEQFDSPDPLRSLEELIAQYKAPHLPGMPRFLGGAVGHAGYDTVRWVENLPNAPTDDRGLPDLAFALYDRMVVFDQINKTVLVVAHARVGEEPQASYEKACRQVDALVERIRSGETIPVVDLAPLGEVTGDYKSTFTREKFHEAVAKAKEYILAGDIFQVVLSQRLEAKTVCSPFTIYRALRVVNPSPFLFLLRQEELSLVGSSPEIMTRLEDGELTIRPLAGTRRRGKDVAEDEMLAAELLADPKERAEHIMLVDLGRNDVGLVSEFGSVRLRDVLTVERYSHVMHLCSTVTGRLRPGMSALDALRACLPAGTLSGAPKVRAMQIIDELEPVRRGPYGGAVGYVDFSGNMDTCIALRTLVLQGGVAHLQAGAGVVADSVPENEWQETLNKARGLLRALKLAEQMDSQKDQTD
jgi:anthranilate synthase component 1